MKTLNSNNKQPSHQYVCEGCCILLCCITVQYFMNNIWVGDTVYCIVDDEFEPFIITQQILKERFIRIADSKFVIIDDWFIECKNIQ